MAAEQRDRGDASGGRESEVTTWASDLEHGRTASPTPTAGDLAQEQDPTDTEAAPTDGDDRDPKKQQRDKASERNEEQEGEIPDFVEYRPSNWPRYLFGLMFLLTAVAAVVAVFWAVQVGSRTAQLSSAALALLCVAFLWALLTWAPTVISISEGVLSSARGGEGKRFDLRDPQTTVELPDSPRGRGWKARFAARGQGKMTLRRRSVKVKEFTRVVRHYRDLAEQSEKAEQSQH